MGSHTPKIGLTFTVTLTWVLVLASGHSIHPSSSKSNASPFANITKIQRIEVLDADYQVTWTADLILKNVTFEVTAKTRGFVGFGIAPQPSMRGADVVIFGVDDKGTPYFTDRFSTGTSEPTVDEYQDWKLLKASENATHTVASFTRSFETCDPQDLPITQDTVKVIWSIGATDDIANHAKRGAQSVNLLDHAAPPDVDTSSFVPWHLTVNTTIPAKDTSYWCTMHKTPEYPDGKKRHIVGFRVKLEAPRAVEFNHHVTLYKCSKSVEEGLPDRVGDPGGQCYEDDGTGMMQAVEDCKIMLYVWNKGGYPLFLPDDVGFAINEEGKSEYFVMEIHYDNPKEEAGVSYETGFEIFTTTELRKYDAGFLIVGHVVDHTMVVPPNSTDFVSVGHCSSSCTEKTIPEEGVNIFNVLLHSHLAGRQLKLRHFRGNEELPWVASNNAYDFNYQQISTMAQEVKFLPGDAMSYECTYTNTERKPLTAVIGGISTRHEMCEAFVMYYPRMTKLQLCESNYPIEKLMKDVGVEEFDENTRSLGGDPVVRKPATMAGKHFSDVLSTVVNWTEPLRKEFIRATRYDEHRTICSAASEIGIGEENQPGVELTVTYPKNVTVYEPPKKNCTRGGEGDGGSAASNLAINAFTLNFVFLIIFVCSRLN